MHQDKATRPAFSAPGHLSIKEFHMFKLSALIGSLALFFSSWFAGFSLPRITQGAADYLLIPLLGYIMIIVAAQMAAKIVPEK